ncbi:hypothetical protein HTZ84_22200 [Haloterrigena sp. SYSU A558-1]|uniref:Small CPxCG-related zinc finger protein n=1 Tax=Haloterrigena gelatinilytica TaxID=2741724 RepID=A0ABX2LFF0_9EURY|nr:hypothetical protein [Haloterrigena gelatinilytica]NUC74979.1 hypothetical protein [Haloterrigena gelatinilytica]
MTRHMTDRKDWVYIAECSEHGDEHVRLEASARAAAEGYQDPEELFPIDECLGCGASLATITESQQTEVLE